MQPQFVRVNLAIRETIAFYEIWNIRDHMARYAGEINLGYLDNRIEAVYQCHQNMEDEINQVIHTNNSNTQVGLRNDA